MVFYEIESRKVDLTEALNEVQLIPLIFLQLMMVVQQMSLLVHLQLVEQTNPNIGVWSKLPHLA